MAMTPEGKVKAKVKACLQARSIWHCTPIGSQFGNAGVPDILCCWDGKFLGIEVKAPGKRSNITDMQKCQLAGIRAAGGAAIVVDDIAQMEDLLNAIHKT